MCDTVILIPLSFCTYNASTIFNGLVYYNQWDQLRWYQILLVIIGIAILLCGVLVLSWGKSATSEEELLTEESLLLGHEIEGLTEFYEGEENFTKYIDNNNLDFAVISNINNMGNSVGVYQNFGDSSNGIINFQKMMQEEDSIGNENEKASLLNKNRHNNRCNRSVSVGKIQNDGYGII